MFSRLLLLLALWETSALRFPAADFEEFLKNPPQNCSTPSAIVETCYAFLQSHLMQGDKWNMSFHYYRPALQKYGPYQWLWDSGSHMMVWSHRNVTNSILDLRTMLQMQQSDGRIPEIIMWGPQSAADLFSQWLQYSSEQFVDLTQMPILPYSLRAIWRVTKDITLLKEFVPKLISYFEWWRRTRDVDGDGLVSIVHGWESGLDASPAYDPAYHIPANVTQPSYLELYPKFDELVFAYKWLYDWNQTALLERTRNPDTVVDSYFIVQDVGVNAIYAAGWGVLGELAELYDPVTACHCFAMRDRVLQSLIANCWNTSLNRFVSLYHDDEGNRVPVLTETVQSLFPLLIPTLPLNLAASIVKSQVTNTSKFWLAYPVPSVAADAPQFQPVFSVDLMWRGPTWPILNWFVMEGLQTHNFQHELEQLMDRWIDLYNQSGVWEQYNPQTGAAYGVEGLGMSTLIVDWLFRLGRVHSDDEPS